MREKVLGGWSMSLTRAPFTEFDSVMYGMVTNLSGLTVGTADSPGWSPATTPAPRVDPDFSGSTLWVYGGGGCSPQGRPESDGDVEQIIAATVSNGWQGVDFDDECSMNIPLVTETMRRLRALKKETSYGFIAGYSWNHPQSSSGSALTDKVRGVIDSGYCDRLVHYCYATAMWSDSDITANVRPALENSLSYGMPPEGVILALTARGLTDWNLNYFLDQVEELDIGGLYIWLYHELSDAHRALIKARLGK